MGDMITRSRVFVLWGAHRQQTHNPRTEPTSVDKGVPELVDLGVEVVSIFPSNSLRFLPGRIRNELKGRGAYIIAVLRLLCQLRPRDGIYTTDNAWAVWVARLKERGLIKNRLVFKWAGFDADWEKFQREGSPERLKYEKIVRASSRIFLPSLQQLNIIQRSFPDASAKLQFWPTGVDIAFYSMIRQDGPSTGLVAVGSDHMRDWPLVVELAKRGLRVTIVTTDPKVHTLIQELGGDRPVGLTLAFDVGLKASAEIMARSDALLISTLPNLRFSGSTTVGVAAALGKPLILDERSELEGYGLIAEHNCVVFDRGNPDSAFGAAEKVLSDANFRRKLGENIKTIAVDVDIRRYAKELAKLFGQLKSTEISDVNV